LLLSGFLTERIKSTGDPEDTGVSECRLKDPLPVPLDSIQMTFQYVVGYTPPAGNPKHKEGPTVSIWAQNVEKVPGGDVVTDSKGHGAMYQSPQLPEGGNDQKYSFDDCTEKEVRHCYSPPVAVNVVTYQAVNNNLRSHFSFSEMAGVVCVIRSAPAALADTSRSGLRTRTETCS